MKREFDNLLCKKYPKLFVNRNGRPRDTAMCWGFSCGDGWFNLLDELCEKIQNHIDETPFAAQVIVQQVKEKYGTLRFYTDCSNNVIDKFIEEAENKSACTCEICGSPTKEGLSRTSTGYVRTICIICKSLCHVSLADRGEA